MSGGLGNHYGQIVLDDILGSGSPATWYAALMTANPTDTGGGTEVSTSGTGYARVALTNNTTNFPNASSSAVMTTGTTIDFGTATGSWGTIVGIAFYDASSAGNLGPWAPLSTSKTINAGDGFKIVAGNGSFTAS